ncbi:MAG: transporter substrate-binding protein, partial [Clostridia bacterium]|nr:transporter substrate-binding protein [Clostridia bacterium]
MYKIIKIMSLVFVICLICGCQGETPEDTEIETEAPVYADLGGVEIKYAVATGHNAVNNVLGYLEDTTFAELAYTRISEVEANFNCKFNIQYMVYNDATAEIKKALVSGDNFADVVQHESYIMQDFARMDGALHGMSELVSQLDYRDTDKWGNKNLLESMFWENDLYGIVPMTWPELLYTSSGYPIVFNGDLVKQAGGTDPREYVEQKKWTWDQFEEILQLYTMTEGENKIYGMAVHPPYFSGMMVASNNVKFAYKDGDIYKAGLYTPEAEAALSRAQAIYNTTHADCFYKTDTSPEGVVDCFINKEAVMASVSSGNIYGVNSKISFEVENTGILPYPAGPNNPEFKWKSLHES